MYKNGNSEYDNLINDDVLISPINTAVSSNHVGFSEEYDNLPKSITKIKVHIIGEINAPGLYELEENSRINDLIILAGGQTEKADLNKVNLAYELSDGEKIYIPSISDNVSTYIYNDAGENVSEQSTTFPTTGKININKAKLEDLETISGVGPSLAQKILNYRDSNGKFKSIEDLKNVSGIGEKKYESIKEYITIDWLFPHILYILWKKPWLSSYNVV